MHFNLTSPPSCLRSTERLTTSTMSLPNHSQPSTKLSKVRQACDCCHARKIRCDGTNPCLNCLSTELQCSYLAIPKKKGPKGRRIGKGSFRKPIQQQFPPPQVAPPQNNSLPVVETRTPELVSDPDIDLAEQPDIWLENFQPSIYVNNEVMKVCLDAFFTHKYPITPILDQAEMFVFLPQIYLYPEQYSLITALCAMIVLSPEIITPPPIESGLVMPTSEFFISETLRARQHFNYIEDPTLSTIHTSFFLFSALFCLGKDNSAWFYIRESMTILQLLRLHEETTYPTLPPAYSTYARRTFWLLFLTERAYALQRHRPLTLQCTISLPSINPTSPESNILSGFLDLVSLFQNFDDSFLSLWNLSTTKDSRTPPTNDSLIRLQEILNSALPHVTSRTEIQQADLLISQQWLKTMVWQLCVSKNLLSSKSTSESMSFNYPISIARDVVHVSHLLPLEAFEANGVGILEKVFDIGCSLADVLSLNTTELGANTMQVGPRDYLVQLMRLLGSVLGGSSKYLQLLGEKSEDCLQGSMPRGILLSIEEEWNYHRIHEIDDEGNDVEIEVE